MTSLSPADLVALYASLFRGRPDVYAIRRQWEITTEAGETQKQTAYIPSTYAGKKDNVKAFVKDITDSVGSANYDKKAVRAHLYGRQFLGVYPLHGDSTVWFAALDFDGTTPEEAYTEALSQYRTLTQEAGLNCYMEVSQSGNGYHLWIFFDRPIDAGVVRRALSQFINRTETYDRMFPNQSKVTEAKPYGNLIALPLYRPRVMEGKSCFIDPETGGQYEDQVSVLLKMDAHRVKAEIIEELARSAPELSEADDTKIRTGEAEGSIAGGTKLIDPRFGCEWVRWMIENPEAVDEPNWYALACNLAQLEGGRELFHHVSQFSTRYSRSGTDRKFDQAVEKNAPHTCEYIRENLTGPGCICDQRFPNRVYHPFGLARIPVFELMSSVQGDAAISEAREGIAGAVEWVQQVEKDPSIGMGIPTGIRACDEHLGFRDATLNVLAARPSIGKTALAMDIAYRLAYSGVPVYFFSLEMSRQQLWRRMLARAAGVSASKMRRGQLTPADWQKVRDAQAELRALPRFPLFIDDTTRDVRVMMDIVWRLKERHGKGIVIIDYLGLMSWLSKENEYAGVSRNSKESKMLAKATDMAVLLLHQFNRQGDDMGIGSETSDSWIRSTGQIEQDADTILFLLGDRGHGIKERELVVQKDRDGEAGIRILMEFNQALMQFGAPGTWFSLNSPSLPERVAVGPYNPWEIPLDDTTEDLP